ncbi:hypothetical protein Leryth_019004 [Lithospermum erythrorhizon]|nr:hypothetical protein Leryth_019004 [Lithospermum erythrorhizon]
MQWRQWVEAVGVGQWGAVGVYFIETQTNNNHFNLWKKYTAISSTISNLLFIGFQIAVELKSAVMDRVQANLDTQLCKTNDQIECDSWFLAGNQTKLVFRTPCLILCPCFAVTSKPVLQNASTQT